MTKKQLLPGVFAIFFIFQIHAQLPPGFVQYQLAEGLNPTDMAVSPDGHIFITEKNGLVRVVEDGVLLPDPFLVLDVNDYNERGLGHIALHPLFPTVPFVYLYYTVPDGSRNRVSRFQANGHFALPGSETVLYECDVKVSSVHHGGAMVFGNDGHLYIATGENGPATGPDTDLGKILRLDEDGIIPDDNPYFSTATGKLKAVYASGFRNPFSMAMQPETGRLYLCDVGGYGWEEINDILPAKDYGWPVLEGKKTFHALPPNYQDPIYNYNHDAGCAIVGAAFYPATGGHFPDEYAGKFFFADYCKGFIGVLNPETGAREQDFMTGIKRPVGIRITPQGDFYYLARAGLGGGSEEDNTASTDGSLWRVVFTGSDAPFVFGHPKDGLFSAGDTVTLQALALGFNPLSFQWQKNGADIAGADSNVLVINNIQLSDSASTFRCIVSNPIGKDTSDEALVRVTANKRPTPVITLPLPGHLYKAGEAFDFAGYANDAEQGQLPPSTLTWKVEFHHDTHSHPGLTPVSGFSEGTYFVQNEGEPSDNVWYRVHLTATDNTGLSRTVTRDVFPQKTDITIATSVPGIEVNVDGLTGISPYSFKSVAGLKRTATVPGILFPGDSIIVFDHWAGGGNEPAFPFVTPDVSPAAPIEAIYHVYTRANGFGLFGQYFQLLDFNNGIEGAPLLSRIDSLVNFEWLEGSPEPGYVPGDNFSVRWTGDVVPYYDDTLTFYVATDDGVRLWVDDSLLVDKWLPQPKLEHSGVIFLKGGQRHPIRMEFFEGGGAASAQLFWSSKRLPKEAIPTSQLYPPKTQIPNRLSGFIWLDSIVNGVFDLGESPIEGAAVLVFDEASNEVAGAATTDAQGNFDINNLPSGDYRCYVLPPLGEFAFGPGAGLNQNGYSDPFSLGGEESVGKNFSFLLRTGAPAESRSWSISPNPGSGFFRFKKHLNANVKNMDIRVFDRSGKLVLEKQLAENEWETTLDLTGMAHGVYLVTADGTQVSVVLMR